MASTSDGSSKAIWLAVAGLAVVPLVAILVFALQDEPERRPRPKRKAPAVATVVEPEDAAPPEPVAAPAPAPEPIDDEDDEHEEEIDEPGVADDPVDENAEKVQQLVDHAARVESSDPKLARQLLRDALALDPKNEPALQSLATKMLIDEKHGDAIDLAKRCTDVNGTNATCHTIAAQATKRAPQLDKLVAGVEQCLVDTPDNADCLHGMASYSLLEGQIGDARDYRDRLLEHAPDSTLTSFVQGRVSSADGEYREARTFFETSCTKGYKLACFRAEALRKEGW